MTNPGIFLISPQLWIMHMVYLLLSFLYGLTDAPSMNNVLNKRLQ
jgi:hypothetical protein